MDGTQALSLYPNPKSTPDVTLERLWVAPVNGIKKIKKINNRVLFIRFNIDDWAKVKKCLKNKAEIDSLP